MFVRNFSCALACALALAGVVAISAASSTQEDQRCRLMKIDTFVNISSVRTFDGSIYYQFRLIVTTDGPASATVYFNGTADNDSYDHYFRGGQEMFTRWLGNFPSGKGRKETVSIRSECKKNPKPVRARLYKPWEPRPLIRPWDIGCPSVLVIDSRGSGAPKGMISPPGQEFARELRLQPWAGFLSGVSIMSIANPYPAVGGLAEILKAKAKAPLNKYNRSVSKGEKWLRRELADMNQLCGGTKMYLVGYSQGAQVTGNVYQNGDFENIAGVLLFGDTLFNPNDSSAHNYGFTVLSGGLGKRQPFNDPKVQSYCHVGDPACFWSADNLKTNFFRMHNNYASLGEPKLAAEYFTALGGYG